MRGDPLTEVARKGGITQRRTRSWWALAGRVIWAGGPLGLWELVLRHPLHPAPAGSSPRNRRPCLSSMASAPGATALLRGRLLLLILHRGSEARRERAIGQALQKRLAGLSHREGPASPEGGAKMHCRSAWLALVIGRSPPPRQVQLSRHQGPLSSPLLPPSPSSRFPHPAGAVGSSPRATAST